MYAEKLNKFGIIKVRKLIEEFRRMESKSGSFIKEDPKLRLSLTPGNITEKNLTKLFTNMAGAFPAMVVDDGEGIDQTLICFNLSELPFTIPDRISAILLNKNLPFSSEGISISNIRTLCQDLFDKPGHPTEDELSRIKSLLTEQYEETSIPNETKYHLNLSKKSPKLDIVSGGNTNNQENLVIPTSLFLGDFYNFWKGFKKIPSLPAHIVNRDTSAILQINPKSFETFLSLKIPDYKGRHGRIYNSIFVVWPLNEHIVEQKVFFLSHTKTQFSCLKFLEISNFSKFFYQK